MLPPSPAMSLGLKLLVTVGRNQVQRNQGQYAALYLAPGSTISENYIELLAGQTYNSNVSMNTSNLVVSTSAPLAFSGSILNGGTVAFQINNLAVLDDVLTSYSLTNAGLTTARINLNYVTTTLLNASPVIYYGTAIPPASYTAAFVQSLQFSNTGNKDTTFTVTANAGEKIYYCYPLIMGQSLFQATGFIGGIGIVGTPTINTPTGPMQYYVYESDNAGLNTVTITVTGA